MTADRYTHARLERVAAEMAKLPELMSTGTDDSACAGLAQMVSDDGQSCPTMAIDTPRDDTENAFLARRGGGAAERAGLENRSPAGGGEDPTPAQQVTSGDRPGSAKSARFMA